MIHALADNTILSNFAHVRRPELLRAAFDAIVVPPAVRAELAEGERLNRLPQVDWQWLETVALTAEEQERMEVLSATLGQGEAACIAIAQTRGWLVLTDDRDARRAAQAVGVAVSGTLGALVNGVRQGLVSVTQADALLAEMVEHGYHSPVSSITELDDLT